MVMGLIRTDGVGFWASRLGNGCTQNECGQKKISRKNMRLIGFHRSEANRAFKLNQESPDGDRWGAIPWQVLAAEPLKSLLKSPFNSIDFRVLRWN